MSVTHGHRKATTLVAGLHNTGMVAPHVIDGTINGKWFDANVAKVLVPMLKLKLSDIFILDNLSSHKRKRCAAGTLNSRPYQTCNCGADILQDHA